MSPWVVSIHSSPSKLEMVSMEPAVTGVAAGVNGSNESHRFWKTPFTFHPFSLLSIPSTCILGTVTSVAEQEHPEG